MAKKTVHRALLSVSDKTGIVEFARGLRALGVEILSTGGTAKTLRSAGIDLVEIGDFTGFPEMLDGRVKTLHPKVHAGILFRRDVPAHVETLASHGLASIDLLAVNLYPFEATVAREGVTWEEAVEQIDIGGPTLTRSAAKNHAHVTIASSPAHYDEILREMERLGGATSPELRKRLALEAFRSTARYDAAISAYFAQTLDGAETPVPETPALPDRLEISMPRRSTLRYGENPHQAAALYGDFLDRFEQLHGKALSYNNLFDLVSAAELAARLGLRGKAVAIIKHANPCGAAVGETVAQAWRDALATDAQSASGGIVAVSEPIDRDAAEVMGTHFIELLLAPDFSSEALEILRRKKNRIILKAADTSWLPAPGELIVRSLPESVLVQTVDTAELSPDDLKVVTRRQPSPEERAAMTFGWDVVRFVKSNAIVYTSSSTEIYLPRNRGLRPQQI